LYINNNKQATPYGRRYTFPNQGGKIAIYVVLGLLVVAFLFFVINTIRCYLTRPRFDDEQEELDDYEQQHGIGRQ